MNTTLGSSNIGWLYTIRIFHVLNIPTHILFASSQNSFKLLHSLFTFLKDLTYKMFCASKE